MARFMLDTDISIYTVKRKPHEVRRMFNIHAGELSISTVTLGELRFGAENSSNSRANLLVIEGYAARIEVLDYDRDAAMQFAQLKVEMSKNQIGAYDLMIAAHARSRGLILVTNNIAEFSRVPGLRVENWVN